jgi:hypothetical protein
LLEHVLQDKVRIFSLHNPSECPQLEFDAEEYDGMLNVYSRSLRTEYKYCSDSNGYWRFDNLLDLLKAGEHSRLHVLTHPVWWTEEALPPRSKVVRSAEMRATRNIERYDQDIIRFERKNITE